MTALLSSDGLRNLGELWYRKHDRDRVGRISEEKICRAAAYLNNRLQRTVMDKVPRHEGQRAAA
jgi:hypothetical protein